MSKKKKKVSYKKKKTKKIYHQNKKKKQNTKKRINQQKNIKKNQKITPKKKNNTSINKPIIKEEKPKITKKKNIFINKIILSIIFIIFLTITILFILKKNLKLELIGEDIKSIEVYSNYQDPGYNATLFNKNINKLVKTSSNLDNSTLGTYQITYKLSSLSIIKKTRKINVIDTEKPEITLKGNSNINLYIGDSYTDEGVNIKDNYDKDLSKNLIIENNLNTEKKGTYQIIYTVSDSSNNISKTTRTINVLEKIIINQNTNNQCNLSNPIEKYICKNNYNVSVGYYNLTNGKTYYYKKDKLYYGASLIKTLDALYLYDKNLINNDLKEYVKLAITISDNPSHHYLVNYIGKENLRNYGKSLGAKYTLTDKNENFGFTNVTDQIAYMKRLYEITKDGQNEELKSFFLNTRKNCLLFENSPKIMHKYGHWEPVYHNSGIVLDENPYIIVILTQEGYNNYQTIIKTLSQLVYNYHYTN